MNTDLALDGKVEIAIGSLLIPTQLIENYKPNFVEGVRESRSLAGVRKRPSGTFETAEASFTLLVPNMDYLKTLWNHAYTAKSGTGTSGNIIFGSNQCRSIAPLPINIHPVCETTDNNDEHIYKGYVLMKWDAERNDTDDLKIETMIYAAPNDDGQYLRLGTGDLTQPSKYDVETMTTVAVTP